MGFEVATFISELVATNPTGADDYATADDHLRLVKAVLQAQFPNFTAAAVNTNVADLNTIVGIGGGIFKLPTDIVTATPPVAEAVTGSYDIYDNDLSDRLARIGYAASNILQVSNLMHGGLVQLNTEDVGGIARTILSGDPDGLTTLRADTSLRLEVAAGELAFFGTANGNSRMYFDNIQRFLTDAAGVVVRSDGDTDTENRLVIFEHQNSVNRAIVGHETSDVFVVRNQIHGGNLLFTAEDAVGTPRTILQGDPDAVTVLRGDTDVEIQVAVGELAFKGFANARAGMYFNNIETARTLVAVSGGMEVDNQSTGGGFERVLTIGDNANAVLDLASGEVTQLANIGATVISASDWTAVAALVGVNTGNEPSASTTVQGIVERATQAEVDAGTDTTRYISPATLAATSTGIPDSYPWYPPFQFITLTNQTNAIQFHATLTNNRTKADFSSVTDIRLIIKVTTASSSANSPRMVLKYRTTDDTTPANWTLDIGTSEVSCSFAATGIIDTGWIAVTAGAQIDNVFIGLMVIGGDGAQDPIIAGPVMYTR